MELPCPLLSMRRRFLSLGRQRITWETSGGTTARWKRPPRLRGGSRRRWIDTLCEEDMSVYDLLKGIFGRHQEDWWYALPNPSEFTALSVSPLSHLTFPLLYRYRSPVSRCTSKRNLLQPLSFYSRPFPPNPPPHEIRLPHLITVGAGDLAKVFSKYRHWPGA